jgi:predicted nuclease with RNAse H fold/dephospho-CoA kinase
MFLDIETTGLSRYYDEITVIGWLYDGCYQACIAGDDPAPLMAALTESRVLVTFNGTQFDLPFLRKAFPGISLPSLHADLRYLGRRAGLTGGQKAIEKLLNLTHRGQIQEVNGFEAVLLWHRYLRGDPASLRRLIEYNRCDVLGMCYVLDSVLTRLVIDPDFWFQPPRFGRLDYPNQGWADESLPLPSHTRLQKPQNTFVGLFGGTPAEFATVVGLDLTGSERRPSGWCKLIGNQAETTRIATDDEIVEAVLDAAPDLVSIDSPLSLPFGRMTAYDDDPGRTEFGIMRKCERELKRRGINVYPCLLPSMQKLTDRGMQLANRLRKMGIPVIESYPGAAQDIMGIPRKGAGISLLRQGLTDFGVGGAYVDQPVSHDELDSITAALVGSFFLASKFEALSGPDEDPLIIPDLRRDIGPPVIGVSGKIAAGKTTIANLLEKRGFQYTRFSSVVDDIIRSRGQQPDRNTRQKIGLDIHNTLGQRWLAAKALESLDASGPIVIDGLRFLEDHAYLTERFGGHFIHLHVAAPVRLRADRYQRVHGAGFEQAEAAEVESEIPRLVPVAHVVIENKRDLDDLDLSIAQMLASLKKTQPKSL